MRKRYLSLSGLILAASLGLPLRQARSEDEPNRERPETASLARKRYDLGVQAYAGKRYVEAALLFEAAAAERANGTALYTAGLAWDSANQPDRAADDFVRCIAIPGLALDKLTVARDRLAALEAVLGRLEVSGSPGTRVQLDNLTEVTVPATLHGSAGAHALTVRDGSGAVERRDVILTIAVTSRIDLASGEASSDTKGTPVSAGRPILASTGAPGGGSHGDVRKTLGFVAIGIGTAALLSGTLLGVEGLSAKDAYDRSPSQDGFDHAKSLENWSTIAFISAGVFVAGGLALVLWPSGSKTTQSALVFSAGPSGGIVRGRF